MALQKHVVNFIELIAHKLGEIELIGYANVVRFYFSEFFWASDPPNSLNFRHNNFFFFCDGGSGGLLFGIDIDDEFQVVCVQAIKHCLVID